MLKHPLLIANYLQCLQLLFLNANLFHIIYHQAEILFFIAQSPCSLLSLLIEIYVQCYTYMLVPIESYPILWLAFKNLFV